VQPPPPAAKMLAAPMHCREAEASLLHEALYNDKDEVLWFSCSVHR